jgi:hypothetical protein
MTEKSFRTAITHLKLDEGIFFNESDAKDILLCQDKARIPVITVEKKAGALKEFAEE